MTEINNKTTIKTHQIIINNSIETVWEYLTDPDLTEKWQNGLANETMWGVGKSIRFYQDFLGENEELENENEIEIEGVQMYGTVLEFTPFKTIQYNLFNPAWNLADIPENYCRILFELGEINNSSTKLDLNVQCSHSFFDFSQLFNLDLLKKFADK